MEGKEHFPKALYIGDFIRIPMLPGPYHILFCSTGAGVVCKMTELKIDTH